MAFVFPHISKPRWRASLAAAVIFALAIRGFIPAGYMPEAGHAEGQSATITVCNGMEAMEMAGMKMPADQPAPPTDNGNQKFQDHAPCPFSVNAVFAGADNIPHFAVPFTALVVLNILAAFVLMRQSRFGNASPRAPPLFS